jgi:hypothetical protein
MSSHPIYFCCHPDVRKEQTLEFQILYLSGEVLVCPEEVRELPSPQEVLFREQHSHSLLSVPFHFSVLMSDLETVAGDGVWNGTGEAEIRQEEYRLKWIS